MPKYPTPDEIAEMKASGYEHGTIKEAERRAARWPVAQELCRQIEEAFAGVTLGAGVGLKEGQGLDDYESAEVRAKYRADDEKADWRRIPEEDLNTCNSSLSFFDAEGMRFHLPAFLIADVLGTLNVGAVDTLTHTGSQPEQFALFSPAQRSAIRNYLQFMADDPDEEFSRAEINAALERFWSEAYWQVPPA